MASVFNKGPFLPVGITPKVRVSSADTTPDFLDNKVVVDSPISKVTLNVGGNEQIKLLINEVGGVWLSRSSSGFGTFGVSTGATFLPIGIQASPISGELAIGDAQFRVPRAGRLISIYVRQFAALTGDDTLTCRLTVNGTADNGIVVTHTSATGTTLGVAGEVLFNQDDLLCYVFSFGGGLTTGTLLGVTAAYTVAPE